MVVRRLVHSMGYRYRLHRRDLPGTPDLVFCRLRKVIFVHGCFWHQHRDPFCRIAHIPRANQDYWLPKLTGNADRDAQAELQLREMGWKVLVIWECQVKDGPALEDRLSNWLRT